jgi:hypothetical protein
MASQDFNLVSSVVGMPAMRGGGSITQFVSTARSWKEVLFMYSFAI